MSVCVCRCVSLCLSVCVCVSVCVHQIESPASLSLLERMCRIQIACVHFTSDDAGVDAHTHTHLLRDTLTSVLRLQESVFSDNRAEVSVCVHDYSMVYALCVCVCIHLACVCVYSLCVCVCVVRVLFYSVHIGSAPAPCEWSLFRSHSSAVCAPRLPLTQLGPVL